MIEVVVRRGGCDTVTGKFELGRLIIETPADDVKIAVDNVELVIDRRHATVFDRGRRVFRRALHGPRIRSRGRARG